MSDKPRVVFDCNTLLQGMASPHGPAGRCVQLVLDGRVALYVSETVLAELIDVAARPRVAAKLRLTQDRVDAFVHAIEVASIMVEDVPEDFQYERDPDDAAYVNLALAAKARLIVSRDQDLLDLMDSSRPDGIDFMTRFPQLRIVTPPAFLAEIGD